MGVVVSDSDVLIGFMNPDDAHHADAIVWMRDATQPQTERWISAVNYSELLIAPLREGKQEQIKAVLTNFSITVATVDVAMAERAAAVRAKTKPQAPRRLRPGHRDPPRISRPDRCAPGDLRQEGPQGPRRSASQLDRGGLVRAGRGPG